jgi:signal transduction histidine kinase
VHKAIIRLDKSDQRISVSVSDQGSGFEMESARLKGRLGLISMKERLRLVGGEISIRSQPSQGTQITVLVPLVC